MNNNWDTPKDFYNELNKEFNFDFDPCPLTFDPIPEDKDGLKIDWGQSNYVNPPYSKDLKEAFILKAIEESKKGKLSVVLVPVFTSNKFFHEKILTNVKEIRFVKGRVKFIGINKKGEFENKQNPRHDSMLLIFKP